jgi:hypothetical protein
VSTYEVAINCGPDVSWQELTTMEWDAQDRAEELRAAYRRLLRAGDDYADTGRRCPQWLVQMHHRVLRQFVYSIGFWEGRCDLASELADQCFRVSDKRREAA